MENDYAVNIVAEVSAESQSESTLSNSLESGLTVEGLRGDADSKKMDECAAGWTNEKHNSYLDYLENSFVRQLYSLLGGGGGETQRLTSTRHVESNSHNSTDQFTVLQIGCRQKVSFGNKRAHLEIKKPGDQAFTRTSVRNSLGHEYPPQSTAEEASGQNFREEVEEKGYNSEVSRKRRRGANYDDSSLNDQVVP